MVILKEMRDTKKCRTLLEYGRQFRVVRCISVRPLPITALLARRITIAFCFTFRGRLKRHFPRRLIERRGRKECPLFNIFL